MLSNHHIGATVVVALITASPAVICAIIAGVFAYLSNRKSNRTAADIEKYKTATSRDLERLKTKLAHGQLISSTQWTTEFAAYQALWKSFVPVRTIARKIVLREGELTEFGLEPGDIPEAVTMENIRNLLHKYAAASSECMSAINEYAPFYAANIRIKANEVHGIAHQIFQTNLALHVARQKGQLISTDMDAKRQKELHDLMDGTDALEEMIRTQMKELQVFNPAIE